MEPLVFEGRWEDVKQHEAEFVGQQVRVIVSPANGQSPDISNPPQNLAEALKDYIGSANYGDANLSEDTSRKFADLLAARNEKEQQ